ncbi:MAG: hypothetical protein WBV37_01440 [Nocardioidaceae bacterium]
MTEQVPEQIPEHSGPSRRGARAGVITLGAAAVAALVVVAIAVAANKADSPSGDGNGTIGGSPAAPSGDVIARATILDDGTNGPQLCLGGVAESYPPQCGGPDVVGWDWDKVTGFDHANGVRWGEFVVTGTYDATAGTFTLTRPAVAAAAYDGNDLPTPGVEPVWNTPCPEPAGGWQVVDPALTSQSSLEQTMQAAQARADFGGAWIDQSINPAADGGVTSSNEGELNDPHHLILNIAVTGDPQAAEVELRKTWGGPLCVSKVQHTDRELQEIQNELSSQPGLLYSSSSNDHVDVTVIWDDGSLQRQFDQQYGTGTVVVSSALQRVER